MGYRSGIADRRHTAVAENRQTGTQRPGRQRRSTRASKTQHSTRVGQPHHAESHQSYSRPRIVKG